MSTINIRKSQREGARLVIGLAGVSGSGKTFTALQLALGLANGNTEKIGFCDTENRRGSLYSDALGAPFLIGDLTAPFSPQRYIDAIKAFADAGVEVLIIDSATHVWEGLGGCQDIANANRFPDWKTAKREHKRFMDAMLQSPMHIICCLRAREKTDFTDTKNPKPLGLQPICEANFMFEMTASAMMHDMGRRQDVMKCPADLSHIFTGKGYITAEHGKRLRAWVDGAKQLDPSVEHYRGLIQLATEGGVTALRAAWESTPKAIQKALGKAFIESAKASAEAFDKQRADAAQDSELDPSVDALNAAASAATVNPATIDPATGEIDAPAGGTDEDFF